MTEPHTTFVPPATNTTMTALSLWAMRNVRPTHNIVAR